jgi:SOS response regulatory protein OraA/RecX
VTQSRSAVDAALRSLRYRDLSEHELEQKLAARGFSEKECDDAVATLNRTGVLDERRFAEARATSLAARGAGDALIRHALEGAGVPSDLVTDALATLQPEPERARTIVIRRGPGAKTARYLAGKGFSPDTVADVVASRTRDELG